MRHAAKKPNSIDVTVGTRVRLRRMTLGMSQGALAQAVGVTFQQVQKYEAGTNRISASRLQGIAQALNVPMSYFFEDPGEPQMGNAGDHASYLSADGIRLNRAFMKIEDPRLRARIVDVVRSIADAGDESRQ